MSYRSKRTRAEMTEADAPHVTKPSSLTSPSSDSSTIPNRWGPFCPQKPQEPAVIKQRQLPSLNGSHLGANIDELCAPKAPVSKRQVIPTDAYKKIRQQAQVGVKPPNSEHFVLPDGDGYDDGILKRVGKSVRQYRHYLKKTFFKPASKNREEIYQARPSAIPFDSWIHLVDYWYSDKGKKFAECGKEARASQNHVHTTGSISYANIRAEFEEKNKREPTELEVFMQTHKRKDGSYVKDTVTEEFMLDADTYIHNEVATNPTKSKIQIQNEAFSKLMYAEQIPKRPLGYGFGVKSSEVFGVHGILRKEASKSGDSSSLTLQNMEKMQNMENAVVSLTKNNEELQTKLDKTNFILSKILEGMSSGISSPELAELAKSTLNSQGK